MLRRDRKIVNKMELTRLQRHFGACLRELDQLEESRTARARICAVMTGILGTAFLAGSTFAVTHQPPMVALMVVLAVPGFAGWIAPWFCTGPWSAAAPRWWTNWWNRNTTRSTISVQKGTACFKAACAGIQ